MFADDYCLDHFLFNAAFYLGLFFFFENRKKKRKDKGNVRMCIYLNSLAIPKHKTQIIIKNYHSEFCYTYSQRFFCRRRRRRNRLEL